MKYGLPFFLLLALQLHGQASTVLETPSDPAFIDSFQVVPVSDSRQYIRIRGARDHPVLLYLSGGPGDSDTGRIKQLFSLLSEHFLVVLWDIRRTGKTAGLGNPPGELTLDLLRRDALEMTQYLLQRFNREKLYLAGLSWGTVPGFHMAVTHPELLYGFIAVSPIIDQIRSEAMAIEILVEEAQAEENADAVSELSSVELPFRDAGQLYHSRKWIFLHEGNRYARKKSFRKYVYDWSETWLDVFNESIQTNLFQIARRLECPVYFIVGDRDIRTNYQIAAAYFQQVEAPVKDFFLIEGAGHLIPYRNTIEFQELIIDSILKAN